jgi:hypothetical protein
MNALAGTLPWEHALRTCASPTGELASAGVSQFVDSDGRVPASVIYSTVVPVGVSPWLVRIARTAPVGHRGREIAHALHEARHGDRGYLRDHAHDDGYALEAER